MVETIKAAKGSTGPLSSKMRTRSSAEPQSITFSTSVKDLWATPVKCLVYGAMASSAP